MSRTDLEQMQHLALAEVGMLLQDDRGKWKLRGETSDHLRAAMMINGALKAYHSAGDGWVACAERMPDGDYQYALVYAPCQVAFGCTYGPITDKAIWDADENRWSTGWGQRLTITHWRPLPAPPPAAEITAEKTEGR